MRLERVIGRAMCEAGPLNAFPLGASWVNDEEGAPGEDADKYCAKYVASSTLAFEDAHSFTLATDKRVVCRLSLQDTCIGSNELVVVVVPNVSVA